MIRVVLSDELRAWSRPEDNRGFWEITHKSGQPVGLLSWDADGGRFVFTPTEGLSFDAETLGRVVQFMLSESFERARS